MQPKPRAHALDDFLAALEPLLRRQRAHAAYVFGSHARGDADAYSDIDIIIVAPTDRPFVDRFRDYLPAIANAGIGVDLFVYTPEEFETLQREDRALPRRRPRRSTTRL